MIRRLGKYSIVKKLGEGSMGAVYRAHDNMLDRDIAIKIMSEDIHQNPELKLRFYREAKAAAGLHHPNIVTIHDLGEEANVVFIVMELLEGRNLKDIIRDRVVLPLEKKLSIIAQLSDGLGCAHNHGFIHRDVKPGNIFLTDSGTVKILDFGIARMPQSDLTRAGQRLGTPVYMSPEQVRGTSLDERSDVFSTGIVFYELLTGIHPFRDPDLSKALDNILSQNQFSFSEQFPEAPIGLWPILNTCLAKDPAQRFQSAAELSQACRSLINELNRASTAQVPEDSIPPAKHQLPENRMEKPESLESTPSTPGLQAPGEDEIRGRQMLAQADALLAEGQLDQAIACLRTAIGLLGPEESLVRMLVETRRKIEDRNRERVSRLVQKASEAIAARQFAKSLEALDEVLELEPGSSDAIEMRRMALSEIEAERFRQAHCDQGEQEKSAGFKLLAEGKLRESLLAFQRAAELLGEDTAIRLGIDEAEKGLKDEELQSRILSTLAEAQQLFHSGVLDKARLCVNSVLELSPRNAEATELLLQIDRARLEKEKSDAISLLLSQSEQALGRKEYAEALSLANRALQQEASNTRIRELVQRINEEQENSRRRDQVMKLVAQAEDCLNRQDFSQAEPLIREALAIIPDYAPGLEFLTKIKRARDEKETADRIAGLLSQGRQELANGNVEKAGEYARQILQQDAQNLAAAKLVEEALKAGEKQKREQISALLSQSREAMRQGEFDKATELVTKVFDLDAKQREAKSLVKEIKRTARTKEKEEAKRERELKRSGTSAAPLEQTQGATGAVEETVILKKREWRIPWIWIAAGMGIILIAVFAIRIFLHRDEVKPVDYAAQLTSARANLSRHMYDKAVEIAQGILSKSPGNTQAKAILAEAQKAKKQSSIEVLMMEAQFQRSQNQREESLKTIQTILELSPDYGPALAVRSQIEMDMLNAKTRAEQEEILRKQVEAIQSLLKECKLKEASAEIDMVKAGKSEVQKGLASAQSLLAGCKLDLAKSQIDKIAAANSNTPGLPNLRKRWADNNREMGAIRDEIARQLDSEKRRERLADLRTKAEQLFRQGKYSECQSVISQVLAESPANSRDEDLRTRAADASAGSRNFLAALAAKQLENAALALSRLQKVNPSDPNIGDYRQQLEAMRTSGKAFLSIYRLNEPAAITLDNQPIGDDGEVTNYVVRPGLRKIAVRNSSGKQSSLTLEFADGQNSAYVYNSALPELHIMGEEDRLIRDNFRKREEVHSFRVEHPHGFLKGSCSGELLISGFRIEYKSGQAGHNFSAPFSRIQLRLKEGKIELIETNQLNPVRTFKPINPEESQKITQLWESLDKMAK